MAAEIIPLFGRRRPSVSEVIEEARSDIQVAWTRAAERNRLNDYFVEQIGGRAAEGVNYIMDLNAISLLETRVGLPVAVKAPFMSGQLGWQASFPLKGDHVTTPDMPFETYARCFNLLLYLKVWRDLDSAGLLDVM